MKTQTTRFDKTSGKKEGYETLRKEAISPQQTRDVTKGKTSKDTKKGTGRF